MGIRRISILNEIYRDKESMKESLWEKSTQSTMTEDIQSTQTIEKSVTSNNKFKKSKKMLRSKKNKNHSFGGNIFYYVIFFTFIIISLVGFFISYELYNHNIK